MGYLVRLCPKFEFDGGSKFVDLLLRVAHAAEECDGVIGVLFEEAEQVLALLDGGVVRLPHQLEGLVELLLHTL